MEMNFSRVVGSRKITTMRVALAVLAVLFQTKPTNAFVSSPFAIRGSGEGIGAAALTRSSGAMRSRPTMSVIDGFSPPLARRRSSCPPPSPNLVRTHSIECYQALRDSTPCLSPVTLPKGTKLELGRGARLGTPFSANHTAAASQPTGRIAKAVSWLHLSRVNSSDELDKITAENKNKLVVVDYSTTWCGPCKMVLPKYEALAAQYSESIFLKVIGDSSNDSSLLMKREGVRSVPSFHFWKGGKKVDSLQGANEEDLEETLRGFH